MELERPKRYVDSYKFEEDYTQAYPNGVKKLTITFSESIVDAKSSITFVAFPPKFPAQKNMQEGLQKAIDLLCVCELSASPLEISIYYYGNRSYPNSWSKREVRLNYNGNMRNNMQLDHDGIPASGLYVIDLPKHPYSYIEGIEVLRQMLIAGARKRPAEEDGSYKEDIYCVNLKVLKKIDDDKKYLEVVRGGR